jgi:hypothetical protein
MITVKDYPFHQQPHCRGDTLCITPEVCWGHAGITALLIDLIAGGLHQRACAFVALKPQGGFDQNGGAEQTEVTPSGILARKVAGIAVRGWCIMIPVRSPP